MKNILWSSFALAALIAPANAVENWTTDYPAALAQAAKENKAVMIDFNGSDWCGPCMTLKSKVLATPAFADYAKDKLVLVDVDLPQGDVITPEQKKINEALMTKFGVRAFPTILVLNKDGVVLGGFVGGTDKIDQVTADIDAALANAPAIEAALAKAADLTGDAKVKAWMEAYNLVSQDVQEQNAELKALIMANDPSDVSGFTALAKEKAARAADAKALSELMSATAAEKKLEVLTNEAARTDVSAFYLLLAQRQLLNMRLMACTTVEELTTLKADMTAFGAANPSDKKNMDAMVAHLTQLGDEAVLKQLKTYQDKANAKKAE